MSKFNLPRLDAADIVHFARQLEHIDPTNYTKLFAGILGRKYIPLVEGVSPLVNEYTYRMYEIVGDAKLGGPHSNDHSVVSVKATEHTSAIKQIPVAMQWTVREIKQAAKFGSPLEQLTIQAAMSAVQRRMDTMLAFGESGTTITGLLNHASVDATTPGTKTGTGAGTAWIRAVAVSPDEILSDINLIVAETRTALKQASKLPGGDMTPAFDRFVLLLDSANYAYIASTPRSANSDTTILQYALRNNPWLESIEEWWQCDTADASGGARAVCYARDPMCLGAIIPDEWTQLSPQEEGHDIVVPASGSCGGTVIRYPVAVRYMDDI
jgi:hypothetical protein